MTQWARTAFLAVAAAQLVFLVGFIGVREVALRTGTEVTLQAVPVDPRSLLQGDYAILDYEIARLPGWMEGWGEGSRVYIALRPEGDVWRADRYTGERDEVAGEVFIAGRVDRPGHADFGIGTYFVPEGTGRVVETADDVKVVVRVNGQGDAVIVQVLVDGAPFDPGDADEG